MPYNHRKQQVLHPVTACMDATFMCESVTCTETDILRLHYQARLVAGAKHDSSTAEERRRQKTPESASEVNSYGI
jgi:hypothetical protein